MADRRMAYRANVALTRGQVVQRIANNAAGEPVCDVSTDGTIGMAEIHIGVVDADYAAGDWVTPDTGWVWAQVTAGVLTPGTEYRLSIDPAGLGVGQLQAAVVAAQQVIATFEGSVATAGAAGELVPVYFTGSRGQL